MGKYGILALDFVAVLALMVLGVSAFFVEMRSVLGRPYRRRVRPTGAMPSGDRGKR